MAVKIRLTRTGKTHSPSYRIVAIDSRAKRDGKSLEVLGAYNPLNHKVINLYQDRIDYWISQGAQMTDSAKRICKTYNKSLTAGPTTKKVAKVATAKPKVAKVEPIAVKEAVKPEITANKEEAKAAK